MTDSITADDSNQRLPQEEQSQVVVVLPSAVLSLPSSVQIVAPCRLRQIYPAHHKVRTPLLRRMVFRMGLGLLRMGLSDFRQPGERYR